MVQDILHLIGELSERSPAPILPSRLDELFRGLAVAPGLEAAALEDEIWSLWMYHPHRRAAEALERATADIAAQRYDIAETRLAMLLRARPDFPEAWNKRATLYYILERDEECISAIRKTLELEPRHFGALAGFGEICVGRGELEAALVAFRAALRVNPHLRGLAESCERIGSQIGRPGH